ncbi:MAG: CDP-glycerol glycerophosphotransferase family protein [Candidatus Marinimicrobia bacterium]|nr:CDP-glycerol glycerophosphotransferase family protein [Candidatus Neomarinimicrobiota bacterium]
MKKKTKILFKMFYLYHKAAYDPLIDQFQNDPQYDVALSLTHEVNRTFGVFAKDRSRSYLEHFEKEGYRVSDEKEHFDIVVVPDTVNESLYGRTLLCLLWHGITFTKTVIYRRLKNHRPHKYMVFVEGDYSEKKFKESGCLYNSEIYKVGYPKMDPYFWDNHFDRELILSSLGLDPTKPTVLFAPTYKPTCVYDVKDAIFKATKDFNLIIKLHHYAWIGRFARHSQHKIFERRLPQYSHAVVIPKDQYNILPLMYAADTLVSEASGAVTEFLATGKIGVIYNLDHESLKHTDGEFLLTNDNRKFLKNSFVHVSNPDELREGIEKALNSTKEMFQAAKRERDTYFFKLDGKASERTKAEIERLYNEGTHFNLVE